MAKAASKSQRRAVAVEKAPGACLPQDSPARQWPWFYLLAAGFAIALAVFSPALNGTFIFDDYNLPFAFPQAAHEPAAYWLGGVRPVLMATYWLNYLISGTGPLSYHVVNLLLHAANAVMVYFICDRVFSFPQTGISKPESCRRLFAIFGAAIFLLHPLQTESVDYIAGRSEVVSGFFFFAGWLVFLRSFEKQTSIVLTVKILALAGLAVMSKESAISLPAVIILTDFYFADRPIGAQLKRRSVLYSLFLIGGTGAVAIILRSLMKASQTGSLVTVSRFDYALTQCRVILTYLGLFVVPASQNGDWQLPFYHSFTDGAALVFVVLLLLLLGFTVWLYKRDRLISFGLAAFFLMLAPTSSIVPITDAIAERRMYLPMAGLVLAVGGLAGRISMPLAWRRAVAGAVLLLCAVLSFNRSAVWASDFNMWSDAGRNNPLNFRAHFGIGTSLLNRGDCAGAAREFAVALEQKKSDTELLWNLGLAYQCSKQPEKALGAYRAFAAIQPSAAVYDQIGVLEALIGNAGAAFEAFEQALHLNANDANAYAYRGMARLALHNSAGAEADLRRALELDPANTIAPVGLKQLAAPR